MSNKRFSKIARILFRAHNIVVLTKQEYDQFKEECERMFVQPVQFETIKEYDNGSIAFRELC